MPPKPKPKPQSPYTKPAGYRSGENLARQTQQSAAQNVGDLLGLGGGTGALVRRGERPRERQQQGRQRRQEQERHYDYDYDHVHFIPGPGPEGAGEVDDEEEDTFDPHDFDSDTDDAAVAPPRIVTSIACGPGIESRPYDVVRRHPHLVHPHFHTSIPPELLMRAAEVAVDPAALVREREREREHHERRVRRLPVRVPYRCPMCRPSREEDGQGQGRGDGGGGGANRGGRREDSDDERLIPQIGDYGESDGESYVRERGVLPRWATYG